MRWFGSFFAVVAAIAVLAVAFHVIQGGERSKRISPQKVLDAFNETAAAMSDALGILPQSFAFDRLPAEVRDDFLNEAHGIIASVNLEHVPYLNAVYEGLGDHFRDDLLQGFTEAVRAVENSDPALLEASRASFARWSRWYLENADKLGEL